MGGDRERPADSLKANDADEGWKEGVVDEPASEESLGERVTEVGACESPHSGDEPVEASASAFGDSYC